MKLWWLQIFIWCQCEGKTHTHTHLFASVCGFVCQKRRNKIPVTHLLTVTDLLAKLDQWKSWNPSSWRHATQLYLHTDINTVKYI